MAALAILSGHGRGCNIWGSMVKQAVLVIFLVGVVGVGGSENALGGAGVDKELILTEKEKLAFDKLKATVYSNLTEEYMKQDLFLLRFIRAKNLDVERATTEIFQYLEFMRANNIHNILKEDWSAFEEDYPFYADIVDRQGRPVGFGGPGSGGWNIRSGMVQGKRRQLMRYIYKIAFQVNNKLVEVQKRQPNITQFVLLMNMDGFNPVQHACPMCVSMYISLLQTYERFFPGFAYEIVVINAPQAYLILLDVLRQFLSRHTKEALKVHGTNKSKWKAHLDSLIDPSLLSPDFGGTRVLDR